ncbi:hypothetical protein CW740_07225 [Kangiella profundi]|uniref:Uncharacterized protein n=1 Tax=Kangiella profundi TaxID=1561924 RepID=A0A2K9A8J9_9GAMM|nr:hypothetical protein [Kangiella profundi]AUD79050.1 hypothetical protein CW740_07225 [Kangiella profundi]MBD3666938.1 hypothetical protein [Kangiella sp.]GGF01897.1 hypothetical protein GCM10011356_14520 [Kangiella profundi]
MKHSVLSVVSVCLISFNAQANVLKIDSHMADQITSICKFVQGKGHPEDLRLKGMAWCKVGVDYLPDEFSDQKLQVRKLYNSNEFKELKENKKFAKYLSQARRRIAEVSLGVASFSE